MLQDYKTAKKQHDESVEVLQSAFQQQWQNSENPRMLQSVKRYQQQVEESRKALELAQEALREFNGHMPAERIAIYEAEIREWETQLAEAQKAEQEYTKQLLDDPDAAAKRLERMVNGYSGTEAEYSNQQINQLRSLKGDVELIESKILSLQRDIQRIRQLAVEQESRLQIQAMMDAAIPRFNQTCDTLRQAWEELQSLATEHGIRVVSPHNLQIPTGAKFKQSNSPHEKTSTIYITFDK